jgi:hypothetical protein
VNTVLNVKLTIHLHLLLMLRIWSYTPSPPYVLMACCYGNVVTSLLHKAVQHLQQCGLLGCNAIQFAQVPTLRRNNLVPFSGSKCKPNKGHIQLTACFCWFLAWLTFYPENGDDCSSETSNSIQTTRRHISEDHNNHSHRSDGSPRSNAISSFYTSLQQPVSNNGSGTAPGYINPSV